MTTIRDIFPSIRAPGNDVDIRRLPVIRRKYPKVYAAVLFSCVKSQIRLLRALWLNRFPSDVLLSRALKKLIDAGKFTELLDIDSKGAAELIEQAYRREHHPA